MIPGMNFLLEMCLAAGGICLWVSLSDYIYYYATIPRRKSVEFEKTARSTDTQKEA
jgi:hypothetical protein